MNQKELDFLKGGKTPVTEMEDKLDTLSLLSKDLTELRAEKNETQVKLLMDTLKDIEDMDSFKVSIATLEDVLKKVKYEEQQLSQIVIPSILNECSLAEIKLVSGKKITVADKIKASISSSNSHQAFKDMLKLEEQLYDEATAYENVSPLFKEKIVLQRLTEEEKAKAMDVLMASGVPYSSSKDIHWQTLNKYVKEKLEAGQTVPDSINVFQYQETKIK